MSSEPAFRESYVDPISCETIARVTIGDQRITKVVSRLEMVFRPDAIRAALDDIEADLRFRLKESADERRARESVQEESRYV